MRYALCELQKMKVIYHIQDLRGFVIVNAKNRNTNI